MSKMPVIIKDSVLLLDGSKTFWKTRDYLKILIVNHPHLSCLEIICYDPAVGKEYPRIYLDSKMIEGKLDQEIMEETYAAKKEALNRKKISSSRDELIAEIKTKMTMQYAYGRINLEVDSVSGNSSVNLLPSFGDILVEGIDCQKIDVERAKPDDLIPFVHNIVIVKS